MKTIIFVFALTLTLSAVPALAASWFCKNTKADVFDENVTMKIRDGIYEISHSGHSRNTYAAGYVGEHTQEPAVLHKVYDKSTWKDMPTFLTLTQNGAGEEEEIVLSGLSPDGASQVHFRTGACVYLPAGQVHPEKAMCWEGTHPCHGTRTGCCPN